ncbi:MAG TPA: hypothetical protein VK195_07045 [Burkholderiaceae bacterium]|nr:hypothetical protein [Burkholderiaceae bacterium]
MAQEMVATFDGPLNSFSINLSLQNASNADIREFGISARTAKFPILFDTFGSFSGPVTLVGVDGVDTEVVTARFANFSPDKSVKFSGIDPDFQGDVSSGVRVGDFIGSRLLVLFADGTTGFGEFQPTNDGKLRAVATK